MMQDWSNLPDDVIRSVFEKDSTTVQYLRMCAVCKDWRRVLTSSSCPREAPWLMFPRQVNAFNSLCFYDLSESITRHFELPPHHRASFIHGSSYGWLVLEHNNRMKLYNPINGRDIDNLPSLSNTISEIEGPFLCLWKVILSCSPSNTEGCIVVAMFQSPSTWELGHCRIGDRQWTILKTIYDGPGLLDFTFINNSIYTADMESKITVYNLQNGETRTFPFGFQYAVLHHQQIHLAEGSAGLLLVRSSRGFMIQIMTPIHVFLWHADSLEWQQVTNVTDRQIFLSTRQCCALQLEKHQGNIMHYVAYMYWYNNLYRVGINWLNLKNEIFDPDVRLYPREMSNVISGLPSWFTPSLT